VYTLHRHLRMHWRLLSDLEPDFQISASSLVACRRPAWLHIRVVPLCCRSSGSGSQACAGLWAVCVSFLPRWAAGGGEGASGGGRTSVPDGVEPPIRERTVRMGARWAARRFVDVLCV
jgi:hypothetical protein